MLQTGEGIDLSTGRAMLANLRIAFPCEVKWDDMIGDDRERFCNSCQLSVYNISTMTTPEAALFLQTRLGSGGAARTCVQMYRRADGTVMTDDCPRALRKVRDMAVGTQRRVLRCMQLLVILLLGTVSPSWAKRVHHLAPAPVSKAPEGVAGGIPAIEFVEPKPEKVEPSPTGAGSHEYEPVSLSVKAKILKPDEVKATVQTVCATPPQAIPAVEHEDMLTESERVRLRAAMTLLRAAPMHLSAGSAASAVKLYAKAAAMLSALPQQTALVRFALAQELKLLNTLGRKVEAEKVKTSLLALERE